MWRWLACFAVAIVGCVATLPDDVTITADLAVEAAYIAAAGKTPPPAPAPDSDRCENCNGTGKIGDGRIVMPCPECGGDGVKGEEKSVVHPATFVPLVAEGKP